MINKIELKEIKNSTDYFVMIDLSNKRIVQRNNDVIIKDQQLDIDYNEITNLIKNYITYWDNEYIDNTIIDGTIDELKIYVDSEILEYKFKNKYPYNYNEFIEKFKLMIGIM